MRMGKRGLLALLLGVLLALGLLPGTVTPALAEAETLTDVKYLDDKGVEQTCPTCTVVDGDTTSMGEEGKETWYVVNGAVSIAGGVGVSGDVNLILCDDASLTVTNSGDNAIYGEAKSNLIVYAQGARADAMGKLTATGNKHGINVGGVTINGGAVTAAADGADSRAGINAMLYGMTINGGTVEARSGNNGIASNVSDATISINGGTVTAVGGKDGIYAAGKVTIAGGTVTATGTNEGESRGIYGAEIAIGRDVTSVVASGYSYALAIWSGAVYTSGIVKNAIAGTGWSDAGGTGEGKAIEVSDTARQIEDYKKVQFPPPPAVVTTAPKARELAYDGTSQALVTAGAAEGGAMRYALGTSATTAPTTGWGAAIPTATNAGTYYVWYKAEGNEDHSDSDAACVVVTIARSTDGGGLAPSKEAVSMLRVYNPWSGEHLATDSAKERDALVEAGWRYEGVAWMAPKASKTPVWRLYNRWSGDHHYTTSRAEYDRLGELGWTQERIGFFSDDDKGVPVYRLFNPSATVGTHHYTTGLVEYNTLPAHGWRQEGVGWYGVK